jgi:hypothetical protein
MYEKFGYFVLILCHFCANGIFFTVKGYTLNDFLTYSGKIYKYLVSSLAKFSTTVLLGNSFPYLTLKFSELCKLSSRHIKS